MDSQLAIDLVTRWKIPNCYKSLINNIKDLIHDIADSCNIQIHFFGVPSHTGIGRNEVVDILAKRGAKGISSYDPPD